MSRYALERDGERVCAWERGLWVVCMRERVHAWIGACARKGVCEVTLIRTACHALEIGLRVVCMESVYIQSLHWLWRGSEGYSTVIPCRTRATALFISKLTATVYSDNTQAIAICISTCRTRATDLFISSLVGAAWPCFRWHYKQHNTHTISIRTTVMVGMIYRVGLHSITMSSGGYFKVAFTRSIRMIAVQWRGYYVWEDRTGGLLQGSIHSFNHNDSGAVVGILCVRGQDRGVTWR